MIALVRLELVYCRYEADIAFIDEVKKRQSLPTELLGNRYNESEIAAYKALTCSLIAGFGLDSKLCLLLMCKKRYSVYFLKIYREDLAAAAGTAPAALFYKINSFFPNFS